MKFYGVKMRCLVTGGHGFIGSHVVVDLLRRGHQVTVYDQTVFPSIDISGSYTFIKGDVCELDLTRAALLNSDIIFHLSGMLGTSELFDTPHQAIRTNIVGALNVIIAASQTISRPKLFIPCKPNHWNNIYSATCSAVEKIALSYREHFGMDIRMIRLRNIYGPGQKTTPVRKCVPNFIINALKGDVIEVYGDGTQRIELQYVNDVRRDIISHLFTETSPDIILEIEGRVVMSVTGLVEKIKQLTGSRSEIIFLPRRAGEGSGNYNTGEVALEGDLNVEGVTPVNDGLTETILWYRKHNLGQ